MAENVQVVREPDGIPIHVLANRKDLQQLPFDETQRSWLTASGFQWKNTDFALIPGKGGEVAAAVCLAREDHTETLGRLARKLPPGRYRLDSKAEHRQQLIIGFALAQPAEAPQEHAVLEITADVQTTALIDACQRYRRLVNTPANQLGPEELETEARKLAEAHDAKISVISGKELREGFPTIHAVGMASERPPRLIDIRFSGPAERTVTLVGKGVIFDSGGLNLKRGSGMRWMKKDMGGAACALSLADLLAETGYADGLRLLLPTVENAVAGNALRPGDVVTTRAGKRVEIDNTDAEGRLILCDALAYASEEKPDLLMDFATLTGAARVALGPDLPALFCTEDALAKTLLAAGREVNDPLWRLPLHAPYQEYLNSSFADFKNSQDGPFAGAIVAALFLQRFVPASQRWAHIDVYAWNNSDRPAIPFGGRAQALRASYAALVEQLSNEGQ